MKEVHSQTKSTLLENY